MEDSLFREKAMEKISSPENLDDYIHVTRPSVWLMLAAVILILFGLLIWSTTADIESFATGTAEVRDGKMYVQFDDERIGQKVQYGMRVIAGESESTITSVGIGEDGNTFAVAPTDLAEGSYTVRVIFNQTRLISLLFN